MGLGGKEEGELVGGADTLFEIFERPIQSLPSGFYRPNDFGVSEQPFKLLKIRKLSLWYIPQVTGLLKYPCARRNIGELANATLKIEVEPFSLMYQKIAPWPKAAVQCNTNV